MVDRIENRNKSRMEIKRTFFENISTSSSSSTYTRKEHTSQDKVLNSYSITSTSRSTTSPMRLNSNVQNRFDHIKSEIWNPSESLPKRPSDVTRYADRIKPLNTSITQNISTINNYQKSNYKPIETTPLIPKTNSNPIFQRNYTASFPIRSPNITQKTSTISTTQNVNNKPTQITPSKPKDPNPSQTLQHNQMFSTDCYRQSYVASKRPVFILNNYFTGLEDERKGSGKDVDRLKETFKKFNMDCTVKKDPTTKTIKELAKKYKTKNCEDYDFIMFVIMTHGYSNGTLYATDGHYNVNNDFINVILENKKLENIPKIFVIQACRGDLQQDSAPLNSSKIKPAETLKIFCTYEGFTAFRDINKGTLFIQSLCDKLEEFGETEDLESIAKKVTMELKNIKQTPEQVSTLSKKIIFGKINSN